MGNNDKGVEQIPRRQKQNAAGSHTIKLIEQQNRGNQIDEEKCRRHSWE